MKKLLEMNTDELWGALVRLAAPMEALCADERIYELVKEYRERVKESRLPVIAMACLFSQLIPLLLREHKADTLAILSVIEGKGIAELARMNGAQLSVDVYKAWKGELEPFFTQFGRGAVTG